MIYLMATEEIKQGELDGFIKCLEEYIPIAEKHGMRLVGSWQTQIGTIPEVTDLWAFDNLGHFEKVRQAMAEDPEYRSIYPKIQAFVVRETLKIVRPLPFSPMH